MNSRPSTVSFMLALPGQSGWDALPDDEDDDDDDDDADTGCGIGAEEVVAEDAFGSHGVVGWSWSISRRWAASMSRRRVNCSSEALARDDGDVPPMLLLLVVVEADAGEENRFERIILDMSCCIFSTNRLVNVSASEEEEEEEEEEEADIGACPAADRC
ncbi:hypothetical protein SYNPS1DRAFT_32124 [Syncephalis pseudoplumigaleata]|uniref:Uncharacterized protein n=1 Tax=Syncephalis pseudoplumigaleata TaxID=1712513 RepID=A0A4P9YR54_9FUNG|nr:hypothetical protein SYNPS1DRAFT_32124 [Syncephalis pseudoplumigaleata]|eukprot:RKP22297.1 hypothetical protein SYNPS1DRAFT_32124 [Syncephalis pseudoplumigaleata]